MTSTLRGAINHRASSVAPCEPWAFVPSVPAEARTDKEAFRIWCGKDSTSHLFFTASEGVSPGIRPSKQNPLRALHGVIADYDTGIGPQILKVALEQLPAETRPSWVSQTFSGGARLVWLFEEPLPLDVEQFARRFMRVAYRELRVNKIFPGADEAAFYDLFKLYEVGQNWARLSEQPLRKSLLHYWMHEAAKHTKWDELNDCSIPLSVLAAEIAKRNWPLEGDFQSGGRTNVFWDGGGNPTSCVVTNAGMICFSREKSFYRWAEIFGPSFIKEFQEDKIGNAVSKVWTDGRAYYLKSGYGVWEPHSKEDYSALLRVDYGLDRGVPKNDTASEVDRALVYVNKNRRVTGVIPKVYDPNELLYFNGRRFLNCSAVQAAIPADLPQEWGDRFPWLANFIETCLDPALVPCVNPNKPPMPAKDILLAWWQRLYCSALAGALLKGQAMFLAGGVNRGKTLLSTIIGRSIGGQMDASDFLNSNTVFNKELLEVGLWQIDDAVASQDPQAHQKFSEMVKRAVANPFFSYRAMYRDAQRVEWHGRVLVTLNDDASSIRILPNLDSSIEDKIMVLKFADNARQFPDWHELDEIISSELPFFLRWLVDYKPPQEIFGDKRFGVNSYIHDGLRSKSLHAGGVSDLLELIALWVKYTGTKGEFWEGTASEFMAMLNRDDGLRPLIAKFSVRMLGRKFVEASRIQGSGVTVIENAHGNLYRIALQQYRDSAGANRQVEFDPQA